MTHFVFAVHNVLQQLVPRHHAPLVRLELLHARGDLGRERGAVLLVGANLERELDVLVEAARDELREPDGVVEALGAAPGHEVRRERDDGHAGGEGVER
eukprot:1581909-Rhodomonas_salina.2